MTSVQIHNAHNTGATADIAVPATAAAPEMATLPSSTRGHSFDVHSPTLDGHYAQSDKDKTVAGTPATEINKEATPQQDTIEYPKGAKFILINVAINFVVFLVALDQTIVATATPIITNQFNSFTSVGWIASAYLLTSTVFQPLFGRLYGSYSVKWVFLVAFLIFELGSLICSVSQDNTTFIVGRAIAGLGMAGGYSGCLIIISLIAPLHVRPLLTSTVGAFYGIGGSIGPIIGGAFTSSGASGWRWCFYINLCFIPIVVPVILVFLKVPSRKHETTWLQRALAIDWQGTVLALCSVICILLVFQDGGVKYAWSDSRMIGLIIGFVVILAAFWADQVWMGERATIPLRIFRNRTILGGSIANFFIASTYFSELYMLPVYFQSVRGSSAIRSGVQNLPFIISVIFFVTISGAAVNKLGHYIPILLVGTIVMLFGGVGLSYLQPDSPQAKWAGLQWLAGAGPGAIFMLPFIASSAVLDVKDIELGSAIVIFFQTLGGTISTSMATSIFQNRFIHFLHSIPGADVNSIISRGVSAFRQTTPADILPEVTQAANDAIRAVFYMIIAFGGVSFFSIFLMDLKGKVDVKASQAAEKGKKEANKAKKAKEAGDVEAA